MKPASMPLWRARRRYNAPAYPQRPPLPGERLKRPVTRNRGLLPGLLMRRAR